MLVVWGLAWLTAFMDPMGLQAYRFDYNLERADAALRGPANVMLDRVRAAWEPA